MKGYKGFNKDLTCRDFQYEIGKEYEYDGKIELCESGFHFCKKIVDVVGYYEIQSNDIRLCEIEALGEIIEGKDKCVTNKIRIVREISKEEMYIIGNEGKRNTGFENTGDSNTGDCNTGDCNTGDRNTGYWNTGDWNTTNYSTGCFCSKEEKIKFFDKKSDITFKEWRNSDALYILNRIRKNIWVDYSDMTDEEKEKYPNAKTCDGYLKELDLKEEATEWWNNLSENEKEIIRTIPNYNRTKFRKIMGGAKIG